jgi:hypothetical protein
MKKTSNGDTPLIAAMKKGDKDMVKMLCTDKDSLSNYGATDALGRTAIGLATTAGKDISELVESYFYPPIG